MAPDDDAVWRRLDQIEARNDARFEAFDKRMDARFEALDRRVTTQLQGVGRQIERLEYMPRAEAELAQGATNRRLDLIEEDARYRSRRATAALLNSFGFPLLVGVLIVVIQLMVNR